MLVESALVRSVWYWAPTLIAVVEYGPTKLVTTIYMRGAGQFVSEEFFSGVLDNYFAVGVLDFADK